MNYKLKTGIITLSVLLSLNSLSANAQNSKNRLHVATIDYKCHVELLGGIQTIHFENAKKQNPNGLAHSLVGQKKLKPFSRDKVAIYKVFECVELNEDFTSAQSKAVDEKTTR